MNSDDKFVMWSDGSFTSMGIDASNQALNMTTNSGKLLIKDPVTVVFSTSHKEDPVTHEVKSSLNFEMIPYLFGALLSEGENIWEIDARHQLQNNNIADGLRQIYYHTVAATNNAVRNTDGEVEITPEG